MLFTKYFEKANKEKKKLADNKAAEQNAVLPTHEQQLEKIKEIIAEPTADNQEEQYQEIKKIVTEPESAAAKAEDNKAHNIYCPNCYSTNIQILAKELQLAPHYFCYLCLICRSRFNDETRSPFEFSMPPIEVWIQCWFLLGSTNSIEYVAAKLHLDISVVKQMVKELQNAFQMDKPATKTMSFEEWYKQYSHVYLQRIKDDILGSKRKTELLLHGEATGQPVDTAELRRQKNRHKPRPTS